MQALAASGWFQYLLYLLIAGNLIALALGIAMLVAPARSQGWLGSARKPRSLRQLMKPLEVPRDADTALLRRPRLLGAVLLVSAVLILARAATFVTGMSSAEGGRLIAGLFADATLAPATWEGLWISLLVFIVLGALLVLAVGSLALWRLDLLERWSQTANRWVSTRQVLRNVERSHAYYGLDRLVHERPRLCGGIIIAAALYVLAVLLWFTRG